MTVFDADVIVVGAGPAGLMLAGEVAAAGLSCTVLERRSEQSNLTRAFAVHARTLEILDARGLADELVATGKPVGRLRLFGRTYFDLSGLPTRFPYLLVTPQYNTEHVLQCRVRDLGAAIIGGAEVSEVSQDAHGVSATTGTGTYRAAFLVGADGVRSAVRENLGLAFPGRPVVKSIMLADVRLGQAPSDLLTVSATADGFVLVAPFGDGWYRIFAWNRGHQLPATAPVDFAEVRDVTRRVLGTDYGMHDPRWMSRFHSDERQASHYRVGRVFLAGDAAHCHSPAGGLGMNTGIQDAANLGWKLAAAVHGWAPPALLDSYESERRPVGKAALRTSGTLVRAALLKTPLSRVLRNTLGAALALPAVNRRAASTVSGLSIAYRHGGRRAPDIPLADGGRLYEALRAGRFLLVGARETSVSGWADRVNPVAAGTSSLRLALVRPDGYIAWAGDEGHLPAALTSWCGGPVTSQPAPAPAAPGSA
jgi:2-polyprenyl-6-methoxyphenol hydroxylase-like FAD-dependent oxidoreductase